ncbi:MAG: hypothetical protein R2865_06905 [Deinococcales bacterium]
MQKLFAHSALELFPVQSGGTGNFDESSYVLTPGSAVSTQLVRGDVTIAVGTVTQLEDDKFWAFGHPLLQMGEVGFALAPAYVTYIVPSDVVPFKLADNGKSILGTISEDNAYAISEPRFRT